MPNTFSISETHVQALTTYIKEQKQHHKKITFREEYIKLLRQNGINPKPEYLPDFFNKSLGYLI